MHQIDYFINEKKYSFPLDSTSHFQLGSDILLSNSQTDIVYTQPWYEQGFTEADFLSPREFSSLQKGLTNCISRLIQEELLLDVTGFDLTKYHQFVRSDEAHYKVVSKTRDLFASDFNFPVAAVIKKLEDILGFPLTDLDPVTGQKMHIIVRINRPFSTDFNPPHKDIYEGFDLENHIPLFANFWIPIAGVTSNSNLPLVPSSHLIRENKISRTVKGGQISGNTYRVRMIKSWEGDNHLTRSCVQYGQALIFSSHLIHGLAVNEEPNQTRVALEFRLYQQKQ